MNLSISPPPPAKHRLSYEPFNLAPPPPSPPKLILSIIRRFLALDCLPAKSKTKLKLCYASFRDLCKVHAQSNFKKRTPTLSEASTSTQPVERRRAP